MAAGGQGQGQGRGRGRSFLRGAVVFEAGLLGLALGLGWLLESPPFQQSFDLGWRPVVLGVVATVPVVLALVWCLNSSNPSVVHLTEVVETTVGPLLIGAPVSGLAILSLLAGLGEEALFRGVLQPVLARLSGPVVALVVVSLVFGLVHFVTATYAVLAGLIGLYLGSLMLVTENLLVPITVHAVYDMIALSVLVNRASTRESAGPASGGEGEGVGIGDQPDEGAIDF